VENGGHSGEKIVDNSLCNPAIKPGPFMPCPATCESITVYDSAGGPSKIEYWEKMAVAGHGGDPGPYFTCWVYEINNKFYTRVQQRNTYSCDTNILLANYQSCGGGANYVQFSGDSLNPKLKCIGYDYGEYYYPNGYTYKDVWDRTQ